MYTETAVIAGIISINLPFTVLTLQSVFEGIDPRLEEAAASMGAAPARAFWRVVLPLALPGVLIAAVLCFILCMNAFATPVLLGGPRFQMMAPLIYWEFTNNNNWPFAARARVHPDGTTLGLTGLANLIFRAGIGRDERLEQRRHKPAGRRLRVRRCAARHVPAQGLAEGSFDQGNPGR